MRNIYFDGEFTKLGTDNKSKLLSMGFVADNRAELYIELRYKKKHLDKWVAENILPTLNGKVVSKSKAKEMVIEFIKEHYGEEKPRLVADVNQFDWIYLCKLFGVWEIPFFYIPVDLSTIMLVNGIDPDISRVELMKEIDLEFAKDFKQHNALHDARCCKKIYDYLMSK